MRGWVATSSRGKPLSGARSCLGSLFLAVPRRRVRLKRSQKAFGNRRHLIGRRKKCSFVGFRWLVETAHLPDELQRGRKNFFVRHRWIEVEQGLDVSTHKRHLDVSEPRNVRFRTRCHRFKAKDLFRALSARMQRLRETCRGLGSRRNTQREADKAFELLRSVVFPPWCRCQVLR